MYRQNFSARALALLLALVIAQPFALAQSSQPVLPDPGSPGINKQQQEKLGLQAMGEVYKQMPVLPDSSRETQYIRQVAGKLQATIPADKNWPYQFHVIQASDINAFALPGGPIFVNVGTITAADNEAQLAGVLAHEMSHVYMQHSAKQAPKAGIAEILAGVAGAVLPQSGVGNLGRLGIQLGAGTMLMKYSRKDEAQADAVGAIIMYKAGYNPQAMADFFETLQKKYGNGGLQILSDHPNPGNRTASVQNEIRNWPRKSYVNNSPQFAQVKQDATHIKAYSAQEIANGAKSGLWLRENQKNGSIPANVSTTSSPSSNANGSDASPNAQGSGAPARTDISYSTVKPSGNFAQLNQGNFTIAYPSNWKTAGDQQTVMIVPEGGAAANGISYGVMISSAPGGNGATLDESTQQLIQSLQQDNPGMKVSGDLQRVDINGVQGRSALLAGNSPLQLNGQPLPERDWLVTLPRPDGNVMYLVFISPERDFNQLHPT
ncbi:MAG TPA: M48 family metallopeptidase, partial [Candidatus Angelobacter sp.]|nr:M48 family metallopeptidase [Candidatus Angelobacter sp.]